MAGTPHQNPHMGWSFGWDWINELDYYPVVSLFWGSKLFLQKKEIIYEINIDVPPDGDVVASDAEYA